MFFVFDYSINELRPLFFLPFLSPVSCELITLIAERRWTTFQQNLFFFGFIGTVLFVVWVLRKGIEHEIILLEKKLVDQLQPLDSSWHVSNDSVDVQGLPFANTLLEVGSARPYVELIKETYSIRAFELEPWMDRNNPEADCTVVVLETPSKQYPYIEATNTLTDNRLFKGQRSEVKPPENWLFRSFRRGHSLKEVLATEETLAEICKFLKGKEVGWIVIHENYLVLYFEKSEESSRFVKAIKVGMKIHEKFL